MLLVWPLLRKKLHTLIWLTGCIHYRRYVLVHFVLAWILKNNILQPYFWRMYLISTMRLNVHLGSYLIHKISLLHPYVQRDSPEVNELIVYFSHSPLLFCIFTCYRAKYHTNSTTYCQCIVDDGAKYLVYLLYPIFI